MAGEVTIYDQYGNVIDRGRLTKVDATPMLASMRNPTQDHPSWGMTPEGLGQLLRSSESIDPSRWFALASDIEEREWHYRGVLGTRKGAVAQLPVTVDPAGQDDTSKLHADFIRSIAYAPAFQLSLIDVLDALGKGVSYIEMVWELVERQLIPTQLLWRDQRWFRVKPDDLTTPLLYDDQGIPQPLTPYKWIIHTPRLISGLPIRGGLARPAAWAWMFKNFDIKAWSIFLEVFGHPLRVGHYPASAKYEEKATLLNAVASLGIDAAAIIPEGMKIEFIQAAAGSSGGAVFKDMAEYLDQQISKLVLGQTSTTDAIAGGHAVGRVQNHVREDIERLDSMQLSATLNRDMVKPAIDLNFGPQKRYPILTVGRAETQDLQTLFTNLPALVDRGLKVSQTQMYELLGLEEPAANADVLIPAPGGQPGPSSSPTDLARAAGNGGGDGGDVAASQLPGGTPPSDSVDALADEMAGDFTLVQDIREQVAAAIDEATSFDDLKARIDGLAKGPAGKKFVEKLGLSMFNARLAGELGAPIGPTEE